MPTTVPALHISTEQRNVSHLPARIPTPSHRHAAPSAPWPWMDLDSVMEPILPPGDSAGSSTGRCIYHGGECTGCWSGYPQSLFPNWTRDQQKRSGIERAISTSSVHTEKCIIYRLDMMDSGLFRSLEPVSITNDTKDMVWKMMQERRPEGTRVRALFVENLSGPALQMLGTRYNIEPFFFSSSLKWIPCRYQEALRPGKGDHITFSLTFVRTNPVVTAGVEPVSAVTSSTITDREPTEEEEEQQVIDTQAPLYIRSANRLLLQDLISIHLVRSNSGSTLISYHPPPSKWHGTSAEQMCSRVHFAGRSVYWQTIFQNGKDSTCLILTVLWHAVYAWDEALEVLYAHICWLEACVMNTNDMHMTQELHAIRAHLLHYESLLDDFRKTVIFIQKTPNPAMDDMSSSGMTTTVPSSSSLNSQNTEPKRDASKELLAKECAFLLSDIARLEDALSMQDKRLKNVMNLTFSLVNIEDSQRMARLAEASGKDSAAMRQISTLTMIFLPASLIASVFGMNVTEINSGSRTTLPIYLAIAIPLTLVTIWIMVSLQYRTRIIVSKERKKSKMYGNAYSEGTADGWADDDLSAWSGLWWPVLVGKRWIRRWRRGGYVR